MHGHTKTESARAVLSTLTRIGGIELALCLALLLCMSAVVLLRPIVLTVPALGVIALLLVLAGIVGLRRLRRNDDAAAPTGDFVVLRLLSVGAIFALDPRWESTAPITLAAALAVEPVLARLAAAAAPVAAGFPGIRVRNRAPVRVGLVFFIDVAAVLIAALAVAVDSSPTRLVAVAVAVAGGLCGIALGIDALLRISDSRRLETSLPSLLSELKPEFLVHWDAPRGTGYQLSMWLPYLERLGRRFLVVVREPSSFDDAVALTGRPVLLRRSHDELDALIVPSLAAAFYVNNATRNANMTRFAQIWHVQLNHGESDKAPSYSPSMRMYDRDFVAGVAAIDRFRERGVMTAPDFFEIVGRPQTAAIRTADRPMPAASPRVLYAPTWAGFNADTALSSLVFADTIIRVLLSRGAIVHFRPHPHTALDGATRRSADAVRQQLAADRARTGRPHRFEPAELDRPLAEAFNEVDALVADLSSVVADFLASGKPYAVSAVLAEPTEIASSYPLARGGAIFGPDEGSIEHALEELLDPRDPTRAVRSELIVRFLGFTDAKDAETRFVEAARALIDSPKTPTRGPSAAPSA